MIYQTQVNNIFMLVRVHNNKLQIKRYNKYSNNCVFFNNPQSDYKNDIVQLHV